MGLLIGSLTTCNGESLRGNVLEVEEQLEEAIEAHSDDEFEADLQDALVEVLEGDIADLKETFNYIMSDVAKEELEVESISDGSSPSDDSSPPDDLSESGDFAEMPPPYEMNYEQAAGAMPDFYDPMSDYEITNDQDEYLYMQNLEMDEAVVEEMDYEELPVTEPDE